MWNGGVREFSLFPRRIPQFTGDGGVRKARDAKAVQPTKICPAYESLFRPRESKKSISTCTLPMPFLSARESRALHSRSSAFFAPV